MRIDASARDAQLPEYVVFQEVVTSKRAYMRGVTAIDPSCLPEIAKGSLVAAMNFALCTAACD
jgi:hypothetical protein